MTKGAVSKVVSRLEDKRLAQRRLEDGCLREQVLALTKRGQELVPHLCALADQNDNHFFGQLDQTEREVLMGALQSLVAYHQLKEVPVA